VIPALEALQDASQGPRPSMSSARTAGSAEGLCPGSPGGMSPQPFHLCADTV
jgi:hypothetical protein